jgi:hypothetical protein
LGGKWFLAKGFLRNVTNVPWCSSLSIHIMQGYFPPLMTTPQVEVVARPTQGENLKPIYMGPL